MPYAQQQTWNITIRMFRNVMLDTEFEHSLEILKALIFILKPLKISLNLSFWVAFLLFIEITQAKVLMWTIIKTFVLLIKALGLFHSVYAMGGATRPNTIAHSSGTGKQPAQSSGSSSSMRTLGEFENETPMSTRKTNDLEEQYRTGINLNQDNISPKEGLQEITPDKFAVIQRSRPSRAPILDPLLAPDKSSISSISPPGQIKNLGLYEPALHDYFVIDYNGFLFCLPKYVVDLQDQMTIRPPAHNEGLLSRNEGKRSLVTFGIARMLVGDLTPRRRKPSTGRCSDSGERKWTKLTDDVIDPSPFGNARATQNVAISELAQRLRMESRMSRETSGYDFDAIHEAVRVIPDEVIPQVSAERAGPKTIAETAERLRLESRMATGVSGLHTGATTTQPHSASETELSKAMRSNSPLHQGNRVDHHRTRLVQKLNHQLSLFHGLPSHEPADAVVSSVVVALIDDYETPENFSTSELPKLLVLLDLLYKTVNPSQHSRIMACHMLLHMKAYIKIMIQLPVSVQKHMIFILGNTVSFLHSGYLNVSGKPTVHLSLLMSRLRWVMDLFMWALGIKPELLQTINNTWDPPQWLRSQIQHVFTSEENLWGVESLEYANFLGAAISTYLTLQFVEHEALRKLNNGRQAVQMIKNLKWDPTSLGTAEHWDRLLNWSSADLNVELIRELSVTPEFSQMVKTMDKDHELYFLMDGIHLLSHHGGISDQSNWKNLFPSDMNHKWQQILKNIFSIQGSSSVTISMQLLSFFCKYKVNLVDISVIATDLKFMMILARSLMSFDQIRMNKTWIKLDDQPNHESIIEKLLLYFTINHSRSIFKGYEVDYIPNWIERHLPVSKTQPQDDSFLRLPFVLSAQLWLNMLNHYRYTGTSKIPIDGIYMELIHFAQSKLARPIPLPTVSSTRLPV
ncbi:uncharacterized protein MELLADRAFT_60921 [Melampsora larici-populina 98AG31]|uniref:Uncharacterized protein n=1 Tax=Melampsora larici-populina (strain 98AG31 / pathotype 3-4-7) TaxID=747676 RepID=F4RCY0_MELLP|nr:uncharacterized protein MELLADRAFT_60921 [Melampsora larici-populina 98AG31]EGG09911.1 hypothetical protein MELLADRAFT_60921 [Melampsora larici-populina 98AG31]